MYMPACSHSRSSLEDVGTATAVPGVDVGVSAGTNGVAVGVGVFSSGQPYRGQT
jgi:hypothetical protein